MANDKKFTAQEAAIAVLKKTQELYAQNGLAKSIVEKDQTPKQGMQKDPNPAAPDAHVNGNPAPGALPQNQEKFAAEGLKGHLKLAKFVGRMEEKRKTQNAAPAEPTAHAAAPAPAKAPAPAAAKAAPMDKGETGHEKGVHNSADPDMKIGKGSAGKSGPGDDVRFANGQKRLGNNSEFGKKMVGRAIDHAKETHKRVLGEMKAIPKPKLPG